MPVLRRTARSGRAHLPARERVPALNGTFAGVPEQEALIRLVSGEVEIRGRLVDASNATLYAVVTGSGGELACVYKPVSGERPLWDFPDATLARREVASYAVSAATGWHVVPPTVFRDGPLGPGSVQLWLQQDGADPAAAGEVVLPSPGAGLIDILGAREVTAGWHTVVEAEDGAGHPVVLAHADDVRLRRIAILDVLLNNADRKAGHVLPGWSGAVHGVDHGLTFHEEPKLRTVLWGFAGSRLLADEHAVLEQVVADLDGHLGKLLRELLSEQEVVATTERAERLLRNDRLPRPRGHRTIPWPPF